MKKIFLLLFAAVFLPLPALADVEYDYPRGEVTEIVEERLAPPEEAYQIVKVKVSEGEFSGNKYEIDSRESYEIGLRQRLKVGDKVELAIRFVPAEAAMAAENVTITDVVRLPRLGILFAVFVAVLLFVGARRGLTSLLGLVGTVAVVFLFILPRIFAGWSPLPVVLVGSAVILAVAVYGTHGRRPSTHAAFLATVSGLLLTGLLAAFFTAFTRLTGIGSEDAATLQSFLFQSGATVDFRGLLLSGIILGAVGVLDDVAVTQAETVFEISEADKRLRRDELFKKALRVGRHHIASVCNTLVLAYVGASLPLFALFYASDLPLRGLLNAEFMAEEIVRALVGTVGLILTVPIATWLAAWFATRK